METENRLENCLIGRQPILNRNEEVVSYELLFRSIGSREAALFTDVSQASASVILGMLSEFGLEQVLGRNKGFINVELDLLMSDAIEILPRERVVLELLESIPLTADLVKRCRELKEMGFTLALDDHQFDQAYEELYGIVEIIKVDLLQSPADQLAGMMELFRPYSVKLLAEKVETRDEYLQCQRLGFDYFQGYYFARPSVIEKKRIDEAASTLLKLLRLLSEDAELAEIEHSLCKSLGLTYRLLLLVNSVTIGMREKIRTIRHAVVILGRRRMRQWVQLALFAADDSRGMANPLVEMAAVRASFMEQLACRHPLLKGDREAPDQAFMVGILSLLETIYDIPTEEIVAVLNLSVEVKDALVSRAGTLGRLLAFAESMERTFFRVTPEQFEELGLTRKDVLLAQVKAYQWLGESF
ncbi:MAG: EAL domain-containing protein [Geobacteraceae bacterium]|jgi:EAL and modified HD-GYP domain-containing signal transduction protein